MKPIILIFAIFTVALLTFGFYQGMYAAPTEQTMGDIQRIFYYHVPSAWTAFLLFFANFIASIIYLMGRSKKADAWALATAELGVVFCTIVLITGPLWAKPVWGIWWTWDARLTTTFVLWLLFISYLMLRVYLINPDRAEVLAAVVSIIGFADAVFDYMSIRWFRTQHPQPVMGGGPGSGLDPKMKLTVAVSLGAFLCLFAYLVRQRVALAQTARELGRLRRKFASKEAEA